MLKMDKFEYADDKLWFKMPYKAIRGEILNFNHKVDINCHQNKNNDCNAKLRGNYFLDSYNVAKKNIKKNNTQLK